MIKIIGTNTKIIKDMIMDVGMSLMRGRMRNH